MASTDPLSGPLYMNLSSTIDLADIPSVLGREDTLSSLTTPAQMLDDLLDELFFVQDSSGYEKAIEAADCTLDFASYDKVDTWAHQLLELPPMILMVGQDLGIGPKHEEVALGVTYEELVGVSGAFLGSPPLLINSVLHEWKPVEGRVSLFKATFEYIPKIGVSRDFADRLSQHPRFRPCSNYVLLGPGASESQATYLLGHTTSLTKGYARWLHINDATSPSMWTLSGDVELRGCHGSGEHEWQKLLDITWGWIPSKRAEDELLQLFVEWSRRCPSTVPDVATPDEMSVDEFVAQLCHVILRDLGNDLEVSVTLGMALPSAPAMLAAALVKKYESLRLAHDEMVTEEDEVAAERERQAEALSDRRGPEPRPRLIRSPEDAELVARDWMRYWGFDDAMVTPAGADGGIDVESGLGVAQVKAEMKPVGRPVIQQTFGIAAAMGKVALVFGLSGYTPEATQWADEYGIALFSFDFQGQPQPENESASEIITLGVE